MNLSYIFVVEGHAYSVNRDCKTLSLFQYWHETDVSISLKQWIQPFYNIFSSVTISIYDKM